MRLRETRSEFQRAPEFASGASEIPAKYQARHRVRQVGLRQRRIQRNRLIRRRLGLWKRVSRCSNKGESDVSICDAGVGEGERGIFLERLTEQIQALLDVGWPTRVQQVAALEVEIVRVSAFGGAPDQLAACARIVSQAHPPCADDG